MAEWPEATQPELPSLLRLRVLVAIYWDYRSPKRRGLLIMPVL